MSSGPGFYVEEGIELTGDWRSTALLGHPLANAVVTGVYILVLAVGGGRDLPDVLRPMLVVVQLAAMFAFGGRASFVLLVAMLGFLGLQAAWRIAAGKRFISRFHIA